MLKEGKNTNDEILGMLNRKEESVESAKEEVTKEEPVMAAPEENVTFDLSKIKESEEKKELKEKIEEEFYMAHNEMTNTNKYLEMVTGEDFNGLELVLPYEKLQNFIQNLLGVEVLVENIDYFNFYNLYLHPYKDKDLDEADKRALGSTYYPSDIINKKGSAAVTDLFVAKIPAALVDKTDNKALSPFQWTQPVQDVKLFTNKYPEFFGDKSFTPANRYTQVGDFNGFYFVYVCTLPAVLDYYGLSKDVLARHNLHVTVVSVNLNTVVPGATNKSYVVYIRKA